MLYCTASEPNDDPEVRQQTDQFIAEFEIMKKIGYHPNVISLTGICNHEGKTIT